METWRLNEVKRLAKRVVGLVNMSRLTLMDRGDPSEIQDHSQALRDFHCAASPEVVLNLIEEIERLREIAKYAITIMDEKSGSNEGDTAQMLSHEYWDKVRGALLQALEGKE